VKATRFLLKRYRAFDNETAISLNGLTVLTGPNNFGKSTILLGLQLFFSVVSRATGYTRLYRYELDYPKRYEGRPGRRVNSRLSVEFMLDPQDRAELLQATGHRLPESVMVHVEFFNERNKLPKVSTDPAAPPEAQESLRRRLAERVRYVYIPANRGTRSFRPTTRYESNVEAEISRLAFSKVRNTRRRLQAFARLVDDARQEVGALQDVLATELRRYMPALQSISFDIQVPELRELLRLDDIVLNDGVATPLAQKGDGVKNLFTIAVLQYIARQEPGDQLILGIEEPEAHLHSNAVYMLKPELRALAHQNQHQVMITTHSPILIERDVIQNNLIVDAAAGGDFSSTVRPAKTLAEIRSCLGIKPQDNMTTAEVVIVVEGDTEVAVCPKFLGRHSKDLADALQSGRVRVLAANGASKASSVIRALARDAASCIALLDNDEEGRRARDDLATSGLIGPKDIFLVPPRDGCAETEFEDLFAPALYMDAINEACGTAMTVADFEAARTRSGGRGNRYAKWSVVIEQELDRRGKVWAEVKIASRHAFARAVAVKTSELNLDDFPALKDIAVRTATMLLEEEKQRQQQ